MRATGRDLAIEEFQRSLELDPTDADLFCRVGVAYQRRGDLVLAVQALERALEQKPSPQNHSVLGDLLMA